MSAVVAKRKAGSAKPDEEKKKRPKKDGKPKVKKPLTASRVATQITNQVFKDMSKGQTFDAAEAKAYKERIKACVMPRLLAFEDEIRAKSS